MGIRKLCLVTIACSVWACARPRGSEPGTQDQEADAQVGAPQSVVADGEGSGPGSGGSGAISGSAPDGGMDGSSDGGGTGGSSATDRPMAVDVGNPSGT